MAHAPFNDHFNEGDYTPRSPNLTAQFDNYEPEPLHPQHQLFRGGISQTSPFSPTGGAPEYLGRGYSNHNAYPPRTQSQMVKPDPHDDEYGAKRGRGRGKRVKYEEDEEDEEEEETHEGGGGGIEVKTKFPVARIKRIMQADEDVGKVAQVTPVVVSKALELFMISLITRSAAEAKTRSSKRVLPAHLKAAVTSDEQFDFLNEIVAKVPDAPPPGQRGLQPEGDSDEAEARPGKRRGRRRKAEAEY